MLGAGRSAAFTGLVAGATYSYSAWAFDGSGNASTPVTGHFRLVSAAVLTAPAIASSASTSYIPVAYHSTGSGTAAVRIGYSSTAPALGGPSAWAAGPKLATSGTYAFGKGDLPVPARGGANFRFRAGAVDVWGNVRWSTAIATTLVPFDDRDSTLHYVGTWSHPATPGAWLATTTVTRTGGSVWKHVGQFPNTSAPAPRHFSVVATTMAAGGSVKVYLDGRYVTTVSSRSSATRLRQTIWTSATLSAKPHTLRLVQVSASGWFRLDGIAVAVA